MSDIDAALVDSLKALDPERPIREASLALRCSERSQVPILLQKSAIVIARRLLRFVEEAPDQRPL